ncbi:hypothetical protein NW761_006668 [Fusarium oxysporum]|uniref:Aminoglycoside phosphotransferase domain-containing protein n=1 Tax=Fusarium oxysporum f. sp. raphani TaxID=96318 RepID=A0A8J5UBR8_FUSOX|nr:hypothetical protein Forpi1262_v010646 [Fusarium oxysporum f. sp. raphani]KAJ4033610.1 hypothetical protein NW758_011217 [Fusarium oxysporum]KAJ4049497.1 hypothetical protein NW753_008520 [Fusarium oxysporum]KAJ4050081.1 hypothetical protein NW763_009405 [Fusarium oxysporum]KAJ4090378.1 hypothetical protein NW756_006740 [Fusarium oxysporum]
MTPPSPDVRKALDSVISGTQPRAPSADKINVITKGDGGICSVTGKQGTLWDPVIVAPILPVPAAWLKGDQVLYLKYNSNPDTLRNEYNALRVLKQKTTIPAPRAFDVVPQNTGEENFGYLLMSRVPGTALVTCRDALSDQDYANLSAQLKECVSQMREIPKPVTHGIAIYNTLGEACRDPRIRDWAPIGPFPDEASFSQNLRFSDESSRRGHKIVFTHEDLSPRNIIMERIKDSAGARGWRLSDIIDWETAGYYPEYWDYTKSMFEEFRWPRRHNEMMHDVFNEFGDYSEKLAVERRAWEPGDGI